MAASKTNKDLKTLEAMARIYCSKWHAASAKDAAGVCEECRTAVEATFNRADACPYDHAHNCQDCTTKCQRGENQERIKQIMRYAAPRMIYRHPLMTFEYLRKRRKGVQA